MYDTINIWLNRELANGQDVIKHLSNVTEHQRAGQVNVSGYCDNYKVSLSEAGISLKGSLAKFFLNDNFQTLTRSDSEAAIEALSDRLHLPVERGKVTRIDFAKNFLMRFEPKVYYSYLGESQHYKRLPQDASLYYSNGLRQKLFYNKVAETKARGLTLPDVMQGQNVLRYELRFKSRLTKQFQAEVKASHLSDEKFYMNLFDRWLAEYKSIDKIHSLKLNLADMNSPKDFIKQLQIFAIQSIGQDKILAEIETLKQKKAFDKPEYYSRLKKEIKQLSKAPGLTDASDMVAELDKKINNAKRYYR